MCNIIKKYRLACPFICSLFLIACGNDKASVNNDKTIEIVNYDNSGFSCRIDRNYTAGGDCIKKCQILINDTIAIFRGQTYYEQCQVTLTKPIADCIKSLLYDIYSEQNSVIKDQYINETHGITGYKPEWNIVMNMKGKRIKESVDLLGYGLTFKKPWHPKVEKLLPLIYAITDKMEQDIFKIEYLHRLYKPDEWIIEMFHGEYYEPYNDINSVNYQ